MKKALMVNGKIVAVFYDTPDIAVSTPDDVDFVSPLQDYLVSTVQSNMLYDKVFHPDWKFVELKDKDGRIEMKTPSGTLVAETMADPANPGISIDFIQNGVTYEIPIALFEIPENLIKGTINGNPKLPRRWELVENELKFPHLLVWGDSQDEDPTHDFVFTEWNALFSNEVKGGE